VIAVQDCKRASLIQADEENGARGIFLIQVVAQIINFCQERGVGTSPIAIIDDSVCHLREVEISGRKSSPLSSRENTDSLQIFCFHFHFVPFGISWKLLPE